MSLGLVAYGSSDESDEDPQENTSTPPLANGKLSTPADSIVNKDKYVNENCSESQNDVDKEVHKTLSTVTSCLSGNISEEDDEIKLSSNPVKNELTKLTSSSEQKVTKLHDIDFDWNQLTKNYKSSDKSVKISIPSLIDLENEEDSEPVKKKIKPSKSGSGLFALLPCPKNQFGNQVPRQIAKPPTKKPIIKPPVVKRNPSVSNTIKSKSLLSMSYDDSPDEEEEEDTSSIKKVDFFSLDTPKIVAAPDVSNIDIDVTMPSEISSTDQIKVTETQRENTMFSTDLQSAAQYNHTSLDDSSHQPITYDDASSSTSYISFDSENVELDHTALQQLCGRKERQKGATNIQLIDVSGDEIIPDSREWLTKQLTEEQTSVVQSHKKKDGPTTQQRRKHQITYLAFQAKEHELELKNQWANNKLSRKQTQAKYGF